MIQINKSIFAGMLIGLAGLVNLSVGGGVIGALLFSFGLYVIVNFKLDLFTGKAGYWIVGEVRLSTLIKILWGNFLGAFSIAVLANFLPRAQELHEAANAVICRSNAWITMGSAIGCGMLMSIAVDGFKKTKNPLFPIGGVMLFILCGFQHSIAQMFYVWLGFENPMDFINLVPIIFGNFIGCILSMFLIKGTES